MKLNRKLGLLLVAAATVSTGAAVADAATTTPTAATSSTAAPAPGGRHWHRHGGGMLVGVMLRATHQLNLTSDQQSAIKSLLSNARTQREASHTPVDMFTLANPGDPNYASALQSAKTVAASHLQSEVELQSQIYNILTAEQKAKLPQVLADMKSKAEQRRAAWAAQHQAPAAGSN